MFEAAISDGFQQLWLQQEVAERSRVDADIRTLGLLGARSSHREVTFLRFTVRGASSSGSGRAISRLKVVVGVVDQFVFGRHLDVDLGGERRVKIQLTRKAAA